MIPRRYEDVEFDKLPQIVKDKYPLLRKDKKGLYLFGGVGTGKTYAAYGIYKQWLLDREQEKDVIQTINKENEPKNEMRKNNKGESFYFVDAETQKRREELLLAAPKIRPMMRFENVPQMLYYAKRDYKGETDYQDSILESGCVFILDDIGVEKVTEFVEEFMYMLINNQYEKVYPIVITSNLPLSQLAEKLGDRIVSRIKEMCEIVEIKGEDKRLGK